MAMHGPAVRAFPTVARASPPWRGPTPRTLLLVATFAASGAVLLASGGPSRSPVDADLARVLLFMAGLKLALAALAVVVCGWRLSRPARGWRGIAFVGGPPLAVGGALLMLSLHHLGLAALGVHAGLLVVLAAALTDEHFFAGRQGHPGTRQPVPGRCAARRAAPRDTQRAFVVLSTPEKAGRAMPVP